MFLVILLVYQSISFEYIRLQTFIAVVEGVKYRGGVEGEEFWKLIYQLSESI